MPLTYQDVVKQRIVNELANVFADSTSARLLLISIGFEVGQLPQFSPGGNSLEFWDKVCQHIGNGRTQGGFEALLAAAAQQYPYHPVFSKYAASASQPAPTAPTPTTKTIDLVVAGWDDPLRLYDRVRELVNDMHMPVDSVQLGFANQEGILLHLINWTPEQALQLGKLIDATGQTSGVSSQSDLDSHAFRDYLLWQLFVEGPDQARFELNNIRASTKVGDIARGVLGTQYDSGAAGPGMKGRRAVIDHVKPDGSTVRCNPDKTLHESDIRDGDTLNVAPESTAGSVNPIVREEALARVRAQIVDFAQSHPGFLVEANARHIPTEYTFKFQAPSFAPPPVPGALPIEIVAHEVFLILPTDFPMKAPAVFWQSAIFHPNVDPKDGEVCLGDLGTHYRPGMNFAKLCQMLMDIASYQNYATQEGYNMDAQKWAVSEEGQIAIETRGGKSVFRKLYDEIRTPRPLSIKRLGPTKEATIQRSVEEKDE